MILHLNSPRGGLVYAWMWIWLSYLAFLMGNSYAQTRISSSVIMGIDFGTEYLKAAVVKPGSSFEIVLSKDSKRKEISALAFKRSNLGIETIDAFPERLYGSDAISLSSRYPGEVFVNLKLLLAVRLNSSKAIQLYKQRFPEVDIVSADDNLNIGFRSKNFPANEPPFTVEELIAMKLLNLKQNAQNLVGDAYEIRNVVIAHPAYFNIKEKQSIIRAAGLAGLEVSALTTDGLAIGLHYSADRTFPNVKEGKLPEYHIIFDMGAGSCTATAIKFSSRSTKGGYSSKDKDLQDVNVIGVGWDKTLGGDYFNEVILNDMIEKFLETPEGKKLGISSAFLRTRGNVIARLWKEAERMRLVLSANNDASTMLESLIDDVDFKYQLSKQDFEVMIEPAAKRIKETVNTAIKEANLSVDQVNSVILHGGAVRTPFVQRVLGNVIQDGKKLRSNVNADEAAVLGCVFRGAQFSPRFAVRNIQVTDVAMFGSGLLWIAGGKQKHMDLFNKLSPVGEVKYVPMKFKSDTTIYLTQQVPSEDGIDYVNYPVWSVDLTNVTKTIDELSKQNCQRNDITVTIGIQIDPKYSWPQVVSVKAHCEIESKFQGIVDDFKGYFGIGSKGGNTTKSNDETNESSGQVSGEDVAKNGSDALKNANASTEAVSANLTTPSNTREANKVTTKKIEVPIKYTTNLMEKSEEVKREFDRIKSRIRSLEDYDQRRLERSEIFNNLESFTYQARDSLQSDAYVEVSREDDRNDIVKFSGEVSDWLYGDGAKASTEDLREKYTKLKGMFSPVEFRVKEKACRLDKVKNLEDSMIILGNAITNLTQRIREVEHEAEEMKSSSSMEMKMSTTTKDAREEMNSTINGTEAATTATTAKTTTATKAAMINVYETKIKLMHSDMGKLEQELEKARVWLNEKTQQQNGLAETETPVLLCRELESRVSDLQKLVKLAGKWKPTTTKFAKAKAETTSEPTTSTSGTSTSRSSGHEPTASPTPAEQKDQNVPGRDHDEL